MKLCLCDRPKYYKLKRTINEFIVIVIVFEGKEMMIAIFRISELTVLNFIL